MYTHDIPHSWSSMNTNHYINSVKSYQSDCSFSVMHTNCGGTYLSCTFYINVSISHDFHFKPSQLCMEFWSSDGKVEDIFVSPKIFNNGVLLRSLTSDFFHNQLSDKKEQSFRR